jgi:DNA-binding IscR family transcriptional regulator
MIRMTKQADYGIVLMTYFALDGEQLVHNARDLAEKARLPQPTVTKILKVLAREGLLISQRGVKGNGCQRGGYCPVRSNWRMIDRAVRSALAGITLAQMAQPVTVEAGQPAQWAPPPILRAEGE